MYNKEKFGKYMKVKQDMNGYRIHVEGEEALTELLKTYKLQDMEIKINRRANGDESWIIHILNLYGFNTEDEFREYLETITDDCLWVEDYY